MSLRCNTHLADSNSKAHSPSIARHAIARRSVEDVSDEPASEEDNYVLAKLGGSRYAYGRQSTPVPALYRRRRTSSDANVSLDAHVSPRTQHQTESGSIGSLDPSDEENVRQTQPSPSTHGTAPGAIVDNNTPAVRRSLRLQSRRATENNGALASTPSRSTGRNARQQARKQATAACRTQRRPRQRSRLSRTRSNSPTFRQNASPPLPEALFSPDGTPVRGRRAEFDAVPNRHNANAIRENPVPVFANSIQATQSDPRVIRVTLGEFNSFVAKVLFGKVFLDEADPLTPSNDLPLKTKNEAEVRAALVSTTGHHPDIPGLRLELTLVDCETDGHRRKQYRLRMDFDSAIGTGPNLPFLKPFYLSILVRPNSRLKTNLHIRVSWFDSEGVRAHSCDLSYVMINIP